MELDEFGKKKFLVGILKTHSLRTQTSDDRRYVCVRRLKVSKKTYPVQQHIRKCHSGIEFPREWVSKTLFLMHRI